ncbi:transcriptional regulator, TetR family [Desulfuromonas soudanensis]|uniref:Transcriptional regulator, TetR family n=1 Tax=Desulfuromonas soudanensis TaxID=1603606 RepID=A0A0M4D0X1_9BACT|nr:TetR/AcrR family transcriptional regulator [Desulfuromonas soudanensis]ALC16296.1 transcriptional regulator, TetR family [Desulfuromonas soudanensis]
MKTKDKIIETARLLFNEKGTRHVTTNHIAEAAGISPGNLYYHFRNKEDIIRALFERLAAEGFEEYQKVLQEYPPGTLESMDQTFSMIQTFNWRYRFFKRELTALIMNDPLLKERFGDVNRMQLTVIGQSIRQAMEKGFLRPLDDRTLGLLTEEVWLVTLFWLNYLDIGGEEVDEQTLKRGSEMLRNIMANYLTR